MNVRCVIGLIGQGAQPVSGTVATRCVIRAGPSVGAGHRITEREHNGVSLWQLGQAHPRLLAVCEGSERSLVCPA